MLKILLKLLVNLSLPLLLLIGRNKRDTHSDEISDKNCDLIKYLRSVAAWFERWKTRNPSDGLSRETAFAEEHSSLAIIELVEHLLTKEDIEFVLLGLIQSDYLEGCFGWFCQLNGGNYYASAL